MVPDWRPPHRVEGGRVIYIYIRQRVVVVSYNFGGVVVVVETKKGREEFDYRRYRDKKVFRRVGVRVGNAVLWMDRWQCIA
jgi:hypothetical protein